MFSIIVPSYNRKDEIPHLLASLEKQTEHNFEVIIVDDCSKEAVEVEQNYPFSVRVIRNQINQGAAESRNIGAHQAQNDWLLFLDDDDRFIENKCQVLRHIIEKNPEINFIYHPAECVMVNEGFTYFTHPFKDEKEINIESILAANKIGGMPMIAVKKALFLKNNGLSTALRSLEDYEFLLKLISDPEFNPKYVDQSLTRCTFHTQRASVSTDNKNTQAAIDYIQQHYVKTVEQQQNFKLNSLYMLAYPHIMNLSRKAAKYYFLMFSLTRKIKFLVITLIILISPKLAINMKRFI